MGSLDLPQLHVDLCEHFSDLAALLVLFVLALFELQP
jgi:hypothetical protein